MTDGRCTVPDRSIWQRVKRHFMESFTGELLSPEGRNRAEDRDQWLDQRRSNAYRYILALLAAVMAPIIAHDYYVGYVLLASGMLGIVMVIVVNIAMLSIGRKAPASPLAVLAAIVALNTFSFYLGQEFSLYYFYPLLLALPVLLRWRWSVLLCGLTLFAVGVPVALEFAPMTVFAIVLSLGLTWLVGAWQVFSLTAQAKRLHNRSITDPLTGTYNRRYLELRARRGLENWERYRRHESLLAIDIDHFKRINDSYGHGVGDEVLQRLVALISQQVRRVDTLCRVGGEEFVLLLSEADAAHAVEVAEKLRVAVQRTQILPGETITISLGVCDISQATSVEHWLELADAALYLAKSNDRNRVELAAAAAVDAVPRRQRTAFGSRQ